MKECPKNIENECDILKKYSQNPLSDNYGAELFMTKSLKIDIIPKDPLDTFDYNGNIRVNKKVNQIQIKFQNQENIIWITFNSVFDFYSFQELCKFVLQAKTDIESHIKEVHND